MKIEANRFTPITLTLESQGEVDIIASLIGSLNSHDVAHFNIPSDWHCKVFEHIVQHSNFIADMNIQILKE